MEQKINNLLLGFRNIRNMLDLLLMSLPPFPFRPRALGTFHFARTACGMGWRIYHQRGPNPITITIMIIIIVIIVVIIVVFIVIVITNRRLFCLNWMRLIG